MSRLDDLEQRVAELESHLRYGTQMNHPFFPQFLPAYSMGQGIGILPASAIGVGPIPPNTSRYP